MEALLALYLIIAVIGILVGLVSLSIDVSEWRKERSAYMKNYHKGEAVSSLKMLGSAVVWPAIVVACILYAPVSLILGVREIFTYVPPAED